MIRQTKKLGEVCEIITGGTPKTSVKDFYGNEFLWAGPSDLGRGIFVTNTNKKLSKKGFRESGIRIIPKDSVMMSCIGYIGKIGIAREEMATNQQINTFVPNHEILDSKYLYYSLIFKAEEFRENSSQTTLPIINKTKCSNIEIPLPPLTEQKEIVKMLDEKMGKIAEAKRLRAEALADTEKILPQTLREIFKEGKQRGWEEKNIGNIFALNYGKGLSKLERSENGDYIAYGANGELGKTDKFLIEGKSIIIGRKGSAGKVIRVSGKFWPTDVTYYVTEGEGYNIDFAFYLFKYLDFTQYAKGVKPGINRNEIYSLKFNLPPLAEQRKIVVNLDTLSKKLRTLRDRETAQLADLKSLERAHLREAFAGEV